MPTHFANHFELFGLPPAYALDAQALEDAYRRLQAEVHPDRHAHAGDAERRASMQWATRVNEAYATLRDPLRRARYLLELDGVRVDADRTGALPSGFLARQMELRERLEEAAAARDAAALERLQADVATERRALEAELAARLGADAVRRLMFLEKLRAEIGDALEGLE
jgi:molecular chaperone HscB